MRLSPFLLLLLLLGSSVATAASAQEHHLVGRTLAALGEGKQYGEHTYVIGGLAASNRTEDSLDVRQHLRGHVELAPSVDSVTQCTRTARGSRLCHFVNDPDNRSMFVEITSVSRSATAVVVTVRLGGFATTGMRTQWESIVTFPRVGNELGTPTVRGGRTY